MDDPGKDEKDFLWENFKFNADQRLKAFSSAAFVCLCRSRFPDRSAEPASAAYSRLFARAETRPSKVVRYTVAFGILFAAEFVFGLGVVLYGAKIAFG